MSMPVTLPEESRPVSLFRLFLTFFRISALTPGGGYAMISLIEAEVDKKKWLSQEEFMILFSTALSFPGPFIMNTAILLGYRLRRKRGALAAFCGIILPPLVAVIGVSILYNHISRFAGVADFVKGAYYTVPGLVAAVLFKSLRSSGWKLIPYLAAAILAVLFILLPGLVIPVLLLGLVLLFFSWRPEWNS